MAESAMRSTAMLGGIALAGVYALVWLVCISMRFVGGSFDALFGLAILTLPSSLLASSLSHGAVTGLGVSEDVRVLFELAAFLVLGCTQYFLLGYGVGTAVQVIFRKG